MKAMKFRVHSPEHSKAIQEKLFEMGCEWSSGFNFAQFMNKPFLFVETNGFIRWEINEEYVKKCTDYAETTLDDLYKMSKHKEVVLNHEYTAIIGDGVVKVGCSEFTFEKIEELYNATKNK